MKLNKTSSILFPTAFALLILILYTLFANLKHNLPWIFPTPHSIFEVFIKYPGLLWNHTLATIYETVVGLILSILLGILIAICMDKWKSFQQTVHPFIIVTQTIPIIALAPLFILWFGYGIIAKVFIVTLVCFFPITVNLYDGFQQVSIEYQRLFRAMNASKWQIFCLVKVPSALPSFFTGLKLAVSYSVMAAVIGEWLGGEKGLGIYMTRATKSYQTAHVFAIIIIISLFSLMMYGIVLFIEGIMLKWQFRHLEEYIDTQNN